MLARPLVAAAALLLAAACAGTGGESVRDTSDTSAASQRSTTTVPAAVGDLVRGVCLSAPALTAGASLDVDEVSVISCDVPHDAEVYAVFDDAEAVHDDTAIDRCLPAFGPYVGVAYEESSLDVAAVITDGPLVCLLYSTNFDPLTGSVRGSRR
jgi:hypothetical protein